MKFENLDRAIEIKKALKALDDDLDVLDYLKDDSRGLEVRIVDDYNDTVKFKNTSQEKLIKAMRDIIVADKELLLDEVEKL